MFANVLKKFFTAAPENENKRSTLTTSTEQTPMTEIRNALSRCRATLAQDAAGVAALMVMLVAALHLPGGF
ncbi:hypothetical protein [Seohaeicola zhoushanensis]|uniref:hypothetical protein n=1 Tax=Seohaeicola zhoushanensis TaxID=1569283 RepID=UPI00167AB03D|nr:hypothetical protein [Seohaeicola zhoushanensis]